MTDPSPYRHRTSLEVRFRDIDAFGHVNNGVFVSYVEHARIRYLLDVIEPDEPFDELPLILARVEVDFRSPILFGEQITVETRVDRIGRSSIGMSHRVVAGSEERLVADVGTVLVCYDYTAAAPMPVPGDWRAKLAAHEGRSLDAGSAPTATAAAAAG